MLDEIAAEFKAQEKRNDGKPSEEVVLFVAETRTRIRQEMLDECIAAIWSDDCPGDNRCGQVARWVEEALTA